MRRTCSFPFLAEDLPHAVMLDGEVYEADFSTGTVMRVILYKGDPLHSLFNAYRLLFPRYASIGSIDENRTLVSIAYEKVINGYPMEGSKKAGGGASTLDMLQDGPALISSFRSVYGMSLSEVKSLHWWEFLCLLEWLPSEGNALGDIRRIRSMDVPSKASPEYKTAIARAKREYAIQIHPGSADDVGRFF